MSNWAQDQAAFMRASGQAVGSFSLSQVALYAKLVAEEAAETARAWHRFDFATEFSGAQENLDCAAELADGAIDTIYVCLGLLHSMGIDPQKAWDEVHKVGNMSKIDPETGTVIKRADGKVQKPEGWTPPDMERVVRESWGL